MREVLGAGRDVQAGEVMRPAMTAEARGERSQRAEGNGGDDRGGSDRTHNSERA
jgi:hypothetical protein